MLEKGLGTPDNPLLHGIYEWSLLAAGATFLAMDMMLRHEVLTAFNPLGGFHHAMAGRAEGFCYINDVVIAIRHALNAFAFDKIAYVDIDAHHGNGVQEAFYDDDRVLFISIHETGRTLYPWSGKEDEKGSGRGEGFNINIPLEPGADDEVYDYAVQEIMIPALEAFAPRLVVAVVGADTMASDPLTHLKLTNNAYQRVLGQIVTICPRVLGLGGGGYDLYRTARCWTLAWAIINMISPSDEFAGLVGGMMFGPEMEVGSLYDFPRQSMGEEKKWAMAEIQRVSGYLKENVLPVHTASSRLNPAPNL